MSFWSKVGGLFDTIGKGLAKAGVWVAHNPQLVVEAATTAASLAGVPAGEVQAIATAANTGAAAITAAEKK